MWRRAVVLKRDFTNLLLQSSLKTRTFIVQTLHYFTAAWSEDMERMRSDQERLQAAHTTSLCRGVLRICFAAWILQLLRSDGTGNFKIVFSRHFDVQNL